jgi:hypothetical protein
MCHWFGTGRASQSLLQEKCEGILNLFQPSHVSPHPPGPIRKPTSKYTVLLGENVFQLFRLFLLMVGNPVCLVMLCLISARRDKVCPQYRVRNWHATNHPRAPQKPFRHVENTCAISKQSCLSKNDEDLAELLLSTFPTMSICSAFHFRSYWSSRSGLLQ